VLDAHPIFVFAFLQERHEVLVELDGPIVTLRIFEIECLRSGEVPEGDAHVKVANGLYVDAVSGPLRPLEAVDALVDLDLELGVDGGEDLHQLSLVLLGQHLLGVGRPGHAVDHVGGGEGGHVQQSLGLFDHDGGAE